MGFKKGMEAFGKNIASIINTILLLVVYFVGVGITSIIAKVSGKHFLETNISKKRATYWTDLNLTTKSAKEYLKQF